MSTWARTREHNLSAKSIAKMEKLVTAMSEHEWDQFKTDMINGTNMTSVYSDLWATELTLTDAEWNTAIEKCRKIMRSYWKKYNIT